MTLLPLERKYPGYLLLLNFQLLNWIVAVYSLYFSVEVVIVHCQMIPQANMLAAVEDAVMTDLEELKLEAEAILSLRVKTICQLYGGSAEHVGSGSEDEETSKYEQKRYEKGRKEALEIAIKLTSQFYRNAALHSAFDFCMKAKDLAFATIIAKAITFDRIKEMIVQEHTDYFVMNDGTLHQTAATALGPLQK